MRVFFVSILMLIGCIVHAQKASYNALKIYGKVTWKKEPLNNAKVIIYESGSVLETIRTNANGKFEYFLDLDFVYELHITKDKFVTKIIEISTEGTNPLQAEYGYEFGGWEVKLMKDFPELDKSILQDPIGRIHYDEDILSFDYDSKFIRSRINKIEALTAQADKLQKEDDRRLKLLAERYKDLVKEANQLFNDDEFSNAITIYEEAIAVDTTQEYPIVQIEKARMELELTSEKDKKYDNLLAQANQLLIAKNYELAKAQYVKAKDLKPSTQLPKTKIIEIESLLAAQQLASKQAEKLEADKQKRYNEHVNTSLAAIETNSFDQARLSISFALKIYPDDENASDIKAEIDDNLAAIASSKEAELTAKRLAISNQQASAKKVEDEKRLAEEVKQQKIVEIAAIAENLIAQGKLEQAKIKFKEAAVLDKDATKFKSKIDELEQKIIINTKVEQAYQREMNLVAILVKKKDTKNALIKLKSIATEYAEKSEPKTMIANIEADLIAVKAKQEEEQHVKTLASNAAAKAAPVVHKTNAQQISALLSYGDNHYRQGEYDQALEKYRAAGKLAPTNQRVKSKIKLAESEKEKKMAVLYKSNSNENSSKGGINIEEEPSVYNQEFLNKIGKAYPEGITEVTYVQGNKTITKRIVVGGGVGTIYRKVNHSWGCEYFFKNSDPIAKFIWDKETAKK